MMDSEIRRLPDGELEIMQAVWSCGESATRSGIEAALGSERGLAPTTVLTFLTRLCEKGFLKVERRGKNNIYTPLVARSEYLARESRSILDRLYGGSLAAFATALCDSGLSREELEELRRLLERNEL